MCSDTEKDMNNIVLTIMLSKKGKTINPANVTYYCRVGVGHGPGDYSEPPVHTKEHGITRKWFWKQTI